MPPKPVAPWKPCAKFGGNLAKADRPQRNHPSHGRAEDGRDSNQ